MADNVKWIKFILGCTDGRSFKKMRKAIIGGVNYRDKLEAVWFELLDFAGQCNRDGAFIDEREIPYKNLDDIACMINREPDELELCMKFYVNEGMVEIIDDIYMLSNWHKYQNTKYFTDKREYDRIKQREYRQKKKEIAEQQKLLIENKIVNDNVNDNVKVFSYILTLISNKGNLEDIKQELIKYGFSNDLAISIIGWLLYKKERKQTYKERGLETLLNKLLKDSEELGEEVICKGIENSMTNNWSGIFYDKNAKPQPKEEKPTDIDFLIAKGFSKEYIMALSEEERAEKRKKWEK